MFKLMQCHILVSWNGCARTRAMLTVKAVLCDSPPRDPAWTIMRPVHSAAVINPSHLSIHSQPP